MTPEEKAARDAAAAAEAAKGMADALAAGAQIGGVNTSSMIRTYNDTAYNPTEWDEFSTSQSNLGYDWNEDAKDFQYVSRGVVTLPRVDADGNRISERVELNSEELYNQYVEQQRQQGMVVNFSREGGLVSTNAIQYHTANSPNFTKFVTPTGGERFVFNKQSYDQASLAAAVAGSNDANAIRAYANFLEGIETDGTDGEDGVNEELDEVVSTPPVIPADVNEEGLKSVLSRVGMASPGFDFSWDEKAAAEVEREYGVATAEAVRNAVKARNQLAGARAEALNQFYGGQYSSASKIEKFGWTGGSASDERMRVAFMNATINSQMMTQKELIQAGYDSELAVAREYSQLNLVKLAEEKYQMAIANAQNFAKLTGYYMAPEITDVMNNFFAAEGLPVNDPRRKSIMDGVSTFLKAQGITEEVWLASQNYFRDVMSFNKTLEREMSDLARLTADRNYELAARDAGVDPVTGAPIVSRPGSTLTTNFPPTVTEGDTTFTRYQVGDTNDVVYFDKDGNAYEAIVDEEGKITMELREEGAMKVVDGIEYIKDENDVYRDKDGYDISQHPREGNTRRINDKLHIYEGGKWVLDPMYARASENWGKIQVFQATGSVPVSFDTGTKPDLMHARDWEAIRNGYYKDGELVRLMRTRPDGEYDTYSGAKYDHYFIYEGKIYQINQAGVDANGDMIDSSKDEFGNYAKFMSSKTTTVLSGGRITVAGMLVDLDNKTEKATAETMGQLVLQAHQAGKLPNDTLINFGSDTSWHYIDGTFRKIENDVWTKDLSFRTNLDNLPFEGGTFVGKRKGLTYGNDATEKLQALIAGTSVVDPTERPTTNVTVTQGPNFEFEKESLDNTNKVFLQASRDDADTFWFNGTSYPTSAAANAAMTEFNKTDNERSRENFVANFEPTSDIGKNIVTNVDKYISSNQTGEQVIEILSKYETSFVPFTLPAATATNRKEFKTLEDYINYRKNLGNNTSKIAELDKQIEFAVDVNNTIKEKLGSFVGEGKEIPFPTFRQSFTAGSSGTDITSLDELLERVRKTNNPEKVIKEFNERLDVVSGLYTEYGSGFKPFTVNYSPLNLKSGEKQINTLNDFVNEHYRASQLTLSLDVTRSTNILLDAATRSQGRTPPNRGGLIPTVSASTSTSSRPVSPPAVSSVLPATVTRQVDNAVTPVTAAASRPTTTTHRSASQPSPAISKSGDVWIQAGSNKSYIFVGSRWVLSGSGGASDSSGMANVLAR